MSTYYTNKLMQKIEQTRQEMILTAKEKTLTDPEVVKISQELDLLLNEFQEAKKENSLTQETSHTNI